MLDTLLVARSILSDTRVAAHVREEQRRHGGRVQSAHRAKATLRQFIHDVWRQIALSG